MNTFDQIDYSTGEIESKTNLMENRVQTSSGEIVEIINGTLHCQNKPANLQTIHEWFCEESEVKGTIVIEGHHITIDFDELVPTHKMESLLEHFTYQK